MNFVTFDELLTSSDFIIVTAALTEETKEIFNQAAFNKMKPSAIFINTSRGGRFISYRIIMERSVPGF